MLITGSACELGRATTLACAEAGFHVIATMRRLSDGRALVAEARERRLPIEIEQLDVSTTSAGVKVRELLLKYGPIYGLVNNAAVVIRGAFEEQSERDVWDQFETNVLGLMAVTRALLPSMRASDRGRIINVSSMSGRVALPGLSTYAAAAHAVEGLSEALRLELAPFGVQVCVLEVGAVKHSILLNNIRMAEYQDKAGPYADMAEQVEQSKLLDVEREPDSSAVGGAISRLLRETAPPYRTVVGLNTRTVMALRKLIPDNLLTDGVRRYLGLPPNQGRSR